MTPWRAAAILNLSVMTNNLSDQVEKKIGGFIFIFTVAKTDLFRRDPRKALFELISCNLFFAFYSSGIVSSSKFQG